MQLKTSFFNRTIFVKNIMQFWPIWVGYTLICLLENPFAILVVEGSTLMNKSILPDQLMESKTEAFFRVMQLLVSPYLICIVGAISALCVFSYIFNTKSTNMIHALPVSRKELFITNYISGFLFLGVPQVVASIISVFVCAAYKITELQYLVFVLLYMLAMTVLFYSMAVLACMISGQFVSAGAFFAVINFLEIGIEYILQNLMNDICFGITNVRQKTLFNGLSPLYYISRYTGIQFKSESGGKYSYHLYGQKAMLLYAIVSLLFICFAYILYKKRDLEHAGDFITVRWLRPVFRWGFTLCISLFAGTVAGQLFENSIPRNFIFVLVLVTVLISGAISFFVAQMFLEKKFNIISKKRVMEYLVVGVVSVGFLFVLHFDAFGIENKIPAQSTIRWVAFQNSGLYVAKNEEDIEKLRDIHENIILHKKEFESKLNNATMLYTVQFVYKTKNGSKLRRTYTLPYDKEDEMDKNSVFNELISVKSKPEIYLSSMMGMNYKKTKILGGTYERYNKVGTSYTNIDSNIDEKDAQVLYDAIQKDLKEGNMKNSIKNSVLGYNSTTDVYADQIYISFYTKEGIDDTYNYLYDDSYREDTQKETSNMAYFAFGKDSKHTIEALKKLGLIKSEDSIVTRQQLNQTS